MALNNTYLFEDNISSNATPPNNTTSQSSVRPEWIQTVALPAFYGLVCLTGVIGNSLALCVFLRSSNAKKVPNVYILNLASADLFFMFGIPFLTYQYAAEEWIFGELMCKMVMAIDGMNMYTGIFTLAAMSVDRYLAIVHAVWSMRHRTLNIARAVCLFLWLFSTILTIPLWICSQTIEEKGQVKCDVKWPTYIPLEKLFILYSFVFSFVLPLIVISACYIGIMTSLAAGSKASKKRRKSIKLGRVGVMVLLAVALFVVCWLPFWTVQLAMLTLKSKPMPSFVIAYYTSLCLSYANSCLNPIVYTFSRKNFRQDLTKTLCGARLDFKSNGDSSRKTMFTQDRFDRTVDNSNDL
ncbi:somatostatin receptor type 5-like [Glandiceps talaboti]